MVTPRPSVSLLGDPRGFAAQTCTEHADQDSPPLRRFGRSRGRTWRGQPGSPMFAGRPSKKLGAGRSLIGPLIGRELSERDRRDSCLSGAQPGSNPTTVRRPSTITRERHINDSDVQVHLAGELRLEGPSSFIRAARSLARAVSSSSNAALALIFAARSFVFAPISVSRAASSASHAEGKPSTPVTSATPPRALARRDKRRARRRLTLCRGGCRARPPRLWRRTPTWTPPWGPTTRRLPYVVLLCSYFLCSYFILLFRLFPLLFDSFLIFTRRTFYLFLATYL
jgi:hypothetical protein